MKTCAPWIAALVSALCLGTRERGAPGAAERPFDQRLLDALLAGTEDPALLVRERPREAFEVFHAYLNAAVAQEKQGQKDRATIGWRIGEMLAPIYDRVRGGGALAEALARYKTIQGEHAAEKAMADERLRISDGALRAARVDEAGARAREALAIFRRIGDLRGGARASHLLASRGMLHDDSEERLALLGEAARLYGACGDAWNCASAWSQLASLHQRASRYSDALSAYREAVKAFETGGDLAGAWWARTGVGSALVSAGRPREALPLLEGAMAYHAGVRDSAARSYATAQVGAALLGLGDYQAAIARFLDAIALVDGDETLCRERCRTLLQLAQAYGELGLLDSAEERLAEVVTLEAHCPGEREPGGVPAISPGQAALARLALDRGRFARARELLGGAAGVEAARAGGSTVSPEAERLLALSLIGLSEPGGPELLEKAREAHARSGLLLGEALCGVELGDAHRRMGRLPEAEACYLRSFAASTLFPEAAWRCQAGLGELREAQGRLEDAVGCYTRAIQLEEDILRSMKLPALRSGFFEFRDRPYHRLVELLAARGETREALEIAERLQSRAAAERLVPGRVSLVEQAPPELLKEREELHIALEAAAVEVARPRSRGEGEEHPGGLRGRHDEIRRRYADLLVSIGARNAAAGEVLGALLPADVEKVQDRLATRGQRAAVLVYLVTPERLHTWAIAPGVFRHVAQDVGEAALSSDIARLRSPFASLRDGTADLSHIRFDTAAARELARILVDPFAGELANVSRIVIVPDGPLHELPFEALVLDGRRGAIRHGNLFEEYRGPRYVLDRWCVAYLPALRGILVPPGEGGRGLSGGTLVLADPGPGGEAGPVAAAVHQALRRAPSASSTRSGSLPGAREEAAAIQRIAGAERARILVGPEATRIGLSAGLDSAEILHIAAHAWADDRSPLFSGIQLAGGPGTSGRLEAHEVLRLDLRFKLVVLSGCETACGPLRRGEGLDSLARSFLLAGARGVVASLWRVDDSASKLMERFYAGLRDGLLPAEALRAAKLALLRQLEGKGFCYALPYFWAPFVLMGSAE